MVEVSEEAMLWTNKIERYKENSVEVRPESGNGISIGHHDMKAMCALVNGQKVVGELNSILGFKWRKERRVKMEKRGYIRETTPGNKAVELTKEGYDVLRSIVKTDDLRNSDRSYNPNSKSNLSPDHIRVLAELKRNNAASIDSIRDQLVGNTQDSHGTHKKDEFSEEYVKHLISELCSLEFAKQISHKGDSNKKFVATAIGAHIPAQSQIWATHGQSFLDAITAETLSVREVFNETDLSPADERALVDRVIKNEFRN